MGGYDSDSSQEDYTETDTLLGFASKEPGDDTISRLGGRPVRLLHTLPSTTARCAALDKIS